ncbi:site-specific integrase [Collimonas pratensis]|uniref:site-specific integrase n=1 Tax=Collimonas pratensis TaxID=279113 RepID=UPI000AF4C612|nr:site-specific integrase [Collimonas pratensis]
MSKYFIKTFIYGSGERSPIAFDRTTGLPLLEPNDWKLFVRRSSTNSHLTLSRELGEVLVLYKWADERKIDLRKRFNLETGLSTSEIGDLKNFCQRNLRYGTGLQSIRSITGEQRKQRIDTIRAFLDWWLDRSLMSTNCPSFPNAKERAKSLPYHIERHRRHLKVPGGSGNIRVGLSSELIARLFEIVVPGSSSNPFHAHNQLRNFIIIGTLYFFGLRRSEALLLRTSDVDFRSASPTISIKRQPDSKAHSRKDVSVKTLERTVPMPREFATLAL